MLSMPLKKKRSKIRFEIHITEHCNLNCKSCNNFSCIAEPEFIDVEEFRRDFMRMGEIFNHDCERIYLLGGEPLLHPEIISLIKIARQCFTSGNIFIFTNGILLPQKEADFWQACHDNNILIWISAYPIKIDIDTIREKAEKFGVNVNWAWGQDQHERNQFSIHGLNLAGDSDIKLNFVMCGSANECIVLKHGKLFTCVPAAHVHHFNKYFHKSINITSADCIDIYKDYSSDEIFQKLIEPIPACRYCTTSKTARTFDWGHTKKEISEWL